MAQVVIPAGGREHNIEIPDSNLLACHVPPHVSAILADRLPQVIRESLAEPIGSRGLGDLVGDGQTVAVIVDDWARPSCTRYACCTGRKTVPKGGWLGI